MKRQKRYKEITGQEMTDEQLQTYEGRPLYIRIINGLSPRMITEEEI